MSQRSSGFLLVSLSVVPLVLGGCPGPTLVNSTVPKADRSPSAEVSWGCGRLEKPTQTPEQPVIPRDIQINGPSLNGTWLGTATSPGLRSLPTSGVSLAVVRLDLGVLVNKDPSPRCDLELGSDARLPLSPTELPGTKVLGYSTLDKPVLLQIGSVTEENGLLFYEVSYQNGELQKGRFVPEGEFAPLCPHANRALLLPGRWDYGNGKPGSGGRLSDSKTEVTLSCQKGALAKCISPLGYRPWQDGLAPLHEACVRAIRADYCGDGQSLTREGTTINLYDRRGIQKDTMPWGFEAGWTPKGAACVATPRQVRLPGSEVSLSPAQYIEKNCRTQVALGASCQGTALLVTEFQ